MWAAIGAAIVGWDTPAVRYGLETGSEAFGRCPRWVSVPVTAYVVGHLFRLWPTRLDPLERLRIMLTPR